MNKSEGYLTHTISARGATDAINDVLNSRDPKSRPPDSLRDKVPVLIHGSLPKYSGPYSVGTMEIEVPVQEPRIISHITRHGNPALRLETVLLNLFYPSALGSGTGNDPSGGTRWSRETWLPRPRLSTAYAYGKLSHIGSFAVPFFAATSMFTKLPAFRNAPIATHWSPDENMPRTGPGVKNRRGCPPKGEPEIPCFPMIIFSHGLAGSRGMYSSMCGEFASYGFVVVALEHRDGSGPRTFINHPAKGEGSIGILENEGHVKHAHYERKAGYDRIDYLFPKGNPNDTDPHNAKGVDKELRAAQIELRSAEIAEAYEIMKIIVSGAGEEISKRNLRKKPYVGSSSKGLLGVDWKTWTNRVRLDSVTMVGHSFGAATTVDVLRQHDQFSWISAGIIYDIWAAGIPDPKDTNHHIRVPLLAINSEAFSYWKRNFDLVNDLVNETQTHGAPAWHMTVRGTVHVNQSDFSLIYPSLCSYVMKMTADPLRALDLNVTASLEFLGRALPASHAAPLRAVQPEGILDLAPVDITHLPHDMVRAPNQRWIAARLRIPHEFSYRFGPHAIARRHHLRKALRAGALVGKSPAEDEIWLHFAPEAEHVEAYCARARKAGYLVAKSPVVEAEAT